MGAVRTLSIPVSLAAAAALLAACGDTVTVERTAEVTRPAAAAFTYLATTPSNAPFGEGTIAVTGAEGLVVRADLTVGETTVPVEFTVASAAAGATVTAVATRDVSGDLFARFGGSEFGEALDAGLAAFKTELEALAETDADFGDLKFDVVDVTAKPFLYVTGEMDNDPATIKLGVMRAVGFVDTALRDNNLTPDSPPIAVETSWDEANKRYAFQAGRAYQGARPDFIINFNTGTTPAGTAIRVIYEGPEDQVLPTYEKVESLIQAGRLQFSTPRSYEVYLDDPTQPGGSVRREIFHLVQGDARRLEAIFPNARPAALPASAPAAAAPSAPPSAQPAAAPGEPAPIAAPPAANP